MKNIFLSILMSFVVVFTYAQQTTSEISGLVVANNQPLVGANVKLIHVPSGTQYAATTNKAGRYLILNIRVGGPYKVTVSFTGFETKSIEDVYATLGVAANADFTLTDKASNLKDVVVTSSTSSNLISNKRSGASSSFGREVIARTPTIGRTINDITKYNAYGNGQSFAGQDSRFNSFTIDGSVFNNGFGLGNQAQAGGRTGSTAISLDAIEEIQLNVAPFDVRQSGFAGASINAVTKSGTNQFSGSVFGFSNNQNMAGSKAEGVTFTKTPFEVATKGFRLGGPIIKNKLFFFINAEQSAGSKPALDWAANKSGATGNVSRTSYDSLADLKNFMKTNLNWDMGEIDNYSNKTSSTKYLARIDYNINDVHKLTLRYSQHDSESDQVISNSSSGNTAGNGNRNNLSSAISGQNTGYIIMDNTKSIVAELNSNFKKGSNKLIVTYNQQNEDRKYRTEMFPTIDILNNGTTYTAVGFDPFTPNNKLNYSTLNINENFSWSKNKHTYTAGLSYEYFVSNNLFFYASNGAWVYNSIADFKTAVLAYKANPNLTTSPVAINRFNYRYTLLPNGQLPWQTLKVATWSGYIQDEIQVNKNLKLTWGLRGDYIDLANTAKDYFNPVVSGLDFKNPNSNVIKINTAAMPKSRLYLSPRFGFNLDVNGKKTTQFRGGTGIFLSRMPYVLISNQLGNNGVNIGLVNVTGSAASAFPFTLDPLKYKPTTTDITKLSGYNLNVNDENLKFPQIWKTDLALDHKFPVAGIVGTVEFIYNKAINALYYIDANLNKSNSGFAGFDNRRTYPALDLSGAAATNARFTNTQIGSAYVLTNTNKGYSYTLTAKLEKPVINKWGGMIGYTYAKSKDLSSVSSTVNANIPSTNGVNYLDIALSDNDLRHRLVATGSYRIDYGKSIGGSTTFSMGLVAATGSKISYLYGNDMNGDGQINDLIFVPKQASDINFIQLTAGTTIFTPDQQVAAFNNYINNHPYLSTIKGDYAQRNGGQFPWLTRMDLSIEQELFVRVGSKKNSIKIRADIFNFGNLINDKWGLGYLNTSSTPLTYRGKNTAGQPLFTMATQVDRQTNSTILLRDAFLKSRTIQDVYQFQLGLRYSF